ncbi:hypothetical protein Q9Q99_14160 [Curtobacterium flaccumfaciens]|nr:hypothetical protein Q9Q99_14160 [Curtobacterium flaccumfaciens]
MRIRILDTAHDLLNAEGRDAVTTRAHVGPAHPGTHDLPDLRRQARTPRPGRPPRLLRTPRDLDRLDTRR